MWTIGSQQASHSQSKSNSGCLMQSLHSVNEPGELSQWYGYDDSTHTSRYFLKPVSTKPQAGKLG